MSIPPPGPRQVAGQKITLVFVGDSVVAGSTAGGGGGAIPAEVTVYMRNGVDQKAVGTYDAAPGFIPHVVSALIDAGFDDIRIYWRALATMGLNVILNDQLAQQLEVIRIAGDTPDLVFAGTAVNNTEAGMSSAIPGFLRSAGNALAKRYPSCGFILFENITQVDDVLVPARPGVEEARQAFRAWANERENRFSVSGDNRTDSGDLIHFSLSAFTDMGTEGVEDGFLNFP